MAKKNKPIPDHVWFDHSLPGFRNYKGQAIGRWFWDEWVDRVGEFPTTAPLMIAPAFDVPDKYYVDDTGRPRQKSDGHHLKMEAVKEFKGKLHLFDQRAR